MRDLAHFTEDVIVELYADLAGNLPQFYGPDQLRAVGWERAMQESRDWWRDRAGDLRQRAAALTAIADELETIVSDMTAVMP